MAFPWHGNESPCNTLCQLPAAFAVGNKKWHSFNTGCTQVMPSLCILCVCVWCVRFAVGKRWDLMFLRSQVYLGCSCLSWVWGGSGGLGRTNPEEQRCHSHSADPMLHKQFPSIQLLLGAMEWPRCSTVCETAVPARRRQAGSSHRGWVICSHRQADGTSWIANL